MGKLAAQKYTDKARQIASMRMDLMSLFRMAETVEEKREVVRAWNAKHPSFKTSLATLYRIDRALKKMEFEALTPRWGKKRSRLPLLLSRVGL